MISIHYQTLRITINDTAAMIRLLPISNIRKLINMTTALDEQRKFYEEVDMVIAKIIAIDPDLEISDWKKQYNRAKKVQDYMNSRFEVTCYDDFARI